MDGIYHHFGGKVYARQGMFKAGQQIVKHTHSYDHLSILAHGIVTIKVEGEAPVTVCGPYVATIKAGKEHMVTAVTDAVWFCIHAAETADEIDDMEGVKIE